MPSPDPAQDWTEAAYVRVFVTFPADYPAVWRDNDLLAWWLRLLFMADRVYPAAAPWPRSLPDEVQEALVEEGTLELVGDDHYRVHGLARLRSIGRQRGVAGGVARAATAGRVAGRFAGATAGGLNGGPPPNAGEPPLAPAGASDAGPDAGPARAGDQRTSQETKERGNARPSSVGPSVTPVESESGRGRDPRTVGGHPLYQAAATALVDEEAAWDQAPDQYPDARPSNRSRYGTPNPTCSAPEDHQRAWRYVNGRGWLCLTCDQADTRSLRDRVDESGHPF